MATKKTTKFDLESAIKELEKIVNTIEQGKISLDESLKLFAQGITLTKKCQQAIKTAEQKVKILTGGNLSDFQIESESKTDSSDESY